MSQTVSDIIRYYMRPGRVITSIEILNVVDAAIALADHPDAEMVYYDESWALFRDATTTYVVSKDGHVYPLRILAKEKV